LADLSVGYEDEDALFQTTVILAKIGELCLFSDVMKALISKRRPKLILLKGGKDND
jgi:hypothetical protein